VDWADRTRPQTAAAATSAPVVAPRVTNTSRERASRSPADHSSISARTRAVRSRAAAGASVPSPVTGTSTAVAASPHSASEAIEAPTPNTSAPSATARTASAGPGSVSPTGTQSSRSRRSRPAPDAGHWVIGPRRVSDSTESTGAPWTSAAAIDTESVPVLVSRTRSREAPEACRHTPFQANGSRPFSSPSRGTNSIAWRAAVASAGCSPYASASSTSRGNSSSA
jgi:hypothetical protein